MTDPYEILEVDRGADRQRIHRAFRQKAREHHPDLNGDRETFVQVKRAYEVLEATLEDDDRPRDTVDAAEAPTDEPRPLDDPSGDLPAGRERAEVERAEEDTPRSPAMAPPTERRPDAPRTDAAGAKVQAVTPERDGSATSVGDGAEAGGPEPAVRPVSTDGQADQLPDQPSPEEISGPSPDDVAEATPADAETTPADAESAPAEEESIPPETEATPVEDETDARDDDTFEQAFFWDRSVDPIATHLDETEPGTPATGDGSDLDLLDRKINEWKSQLLDLTRRNDLIHFDNPPKTKSLPFEDEDPTVVARGGFENGRIAIRKRTEEVLENRPDEVDRHEVVPVDEPPEAQRRLNDIRLNHKQHLRERGVDSLYLALGQLRWFDLEHANREYLSPLFLVPVDLEERAATDSTLHNYTVDVQDDGILVNPALRKKLLADWHIALPPDDALSLSEIDTAFESVYRVVGGLNRWGIRDDVALGIFDFTKVSLYNDLEENRDRIKEHPIVQALVGETAELDVIEGDIVTPEAAELDDVADPADTFQVLDADSSQQEAIEAAKRGRSFVLQGPPGTGKSQTIANIIAEKLAQGSTVLFVSEKQAALNVVKNRLDEVGIGRFCLEAHGTKASQTPVLSTLETELRSPRIKPPDDRSARLAALRTVRDSSNDYENDLFYAPEGWDLTVYEAFGVVSAHAEVPRVETGIDDALEVGQERLDAVIDALGKLGEFETEIEAHHSSPWRHTTLTEVTVDVQSAMETSLDEQTRAIEGMQTLCARLDSSYDLDVGSIATVREVAQLLETLAARPSVDWQAAYLDESLVEEADRLETLGELERNRAELLEELEAHYRGSFFETDGSALHDRLSQYGTLRSVKPGYRSLRRQLLDHTRDDYDPGYAQLREDLRKLTELQRIERRLEDFQDLADRLGKQYRTGRVDWDELTAAVSWAEAFLEYPSSLVDPIRPRLLEGEIADSATLADRASELLAEYDAAAEFFEEAMATDRMRVDGGSLADADLDAHLETLERLRAHVDELPRRIRYENRLKAARDTIAKTYVDRFLAEWHPPSLLVAGFEKAFYTQWLNETYAQTELGSFSAEEMDRTIREFRRLDREQLQLSSIAIQHEVTSRRPELDMQHSPSSEQQIVRREVGKQRNHKPLREVFDEAGSFITTLTPCLMMSPLSVAQYLKADAIHFDTVIFDEASQIMPEDAISSIVRADQAIVAGDSKQLPPTSFFTSTTETTEDVREDLESILKELTAVLPEKHLRWHYRSRSQDLIAFSNSTYYDDTLQIFPENEPDVETGISYVYVEDGVYDRGGTRRNDVEARRVVDEIQAHAENHPDKSLGVVAFSKAQEEAIRDVLEERFDGNPTLEAFVNRDDILDEFFVKNLEMVQGDERDRMIFSVGYGPDAEGTLTMNFGPLNQTGGERRLNVAVTRAREKVTIVSSIQPEDVDLDRTSSRGVADFKRYLEYAKRRSRGHPAGTTPDRPEAFDSAFERSVYAALRNTEMHVERVGTPSNYSIDLGLKPDADADAFALGIQCDGAAYRNANTARDRERTRPSVLTDLGWDVHRIWSPSWVVNREEEIARLREKVFEGGPQSDSSPTADEQFPVVATGPAPEPVETSGDPLAHEHIRQYEEPDLPQKAERPFEEIPIDELRADVAAVVAEYGPLREDVAYRAVVDQWQVSRLDSSVRETMATCTNRLEQRSELVRHAGMLWPAREDLDFVVRVHDDSSRRSIDEIPREELLKAMAILVTEGGTMEADDLQVETARLFGYQRRGARIQSRLDTVLSLGEDAGILTLGDRVAMVEGIDVDAAILECVYG